MEDNAGFETHPGPAPPGFPGVEHLVRDMSGAQVLLDEGQAALSTVVDATRRTEQRGGRIDLEFSPQLSRLAREPDVQLVFVSTPKNPRTTVGTAAMMTNGELLEQGH